MLSFLFGAPVAVFLRVLVTRIEPALSCAALGSSRSAIRSPENAQSSFHNGYMIEAVLALGIPPMPLASTAAAKAAVTAKTLTAAPLKAFKALALISAALPVLGLPIHIAGSGASRLSRAL